MPTVVTHALLGASLGLARRSPAPSAARALVFSALAVVPDVDGIAFHLGLTYDDVLGHRGLAHSLVFAAAASLVATFWLVRDRTGDRAAGARAAGTGRRASRRDWWAVWALAFVTCASHGLLDAMTDGGGGIGFFMPFVDTRYYLPWRPITISPVTLDGFLGPDGGAALASEARLIWAPLLAAGVAAASVRRVGRKLKS
jgi:inner membrane protein